jgi:hypothetical protein
MRGILTVFGVLVLLAIAYVVGARLTSKSVDAIPCDASGQVAYHVHAHLTFVSDGTHLAYPPAQIGIDYPHLCLYWVHTHDATGIIHVEAPHRILPTLGQFFDIWGQPLSQHHAWKYRPGSGHTLRFYVGSRLYRGDPRAIKLVNHRAVTIESGPPFVRPPKPNFHGL